MRRPIFHVIDGSLVVGLALAVIGLGTVISTLDVPVAVLELPVATIEPEPGLTSTAPVFSGARFACQCDGASHEFGDDRDSNAFPLGRLLVNPASTTREQTGHTNLRGEWDAPGFLLDAASAARRHPEAAFSRAEIQTGQWVNNPASIGSTSPP